MQRTRGGIQLSASDLVGHLNCRHLTSLDLAVANGELSKPGFWDPLLEALRERGARHEQAYVDRLRTAGLEIVSIEAKTLESDAVAATKAAMQSGTSIILQGALVAESWGGRADVLRRTDVPSGLGAWSYEVIDTKLARETKAGTVLQLCLYSDLVARVQGHMPDFAYVASPNRLDDPERFRVSDFAAYYRLVRNDLLRALADGDASYPESVEHCDICRWQRRCDAKRHADDHLSLVSGITKVQAGELARHGVNTLTALAGVPLPLPWKPDRGAVASYERIQEQARIQAAGRVAGQTLFEALSIEPGFGLCRLPAPSTGDVFFDLEGDPFVGEGGQEYLFGYVYADDEGRTARTSRWSLTRADEKAAFEGFVDFIVARRARYPDMHVYHYAPYEPGALKRLMGRYASREEEIDQLLRGEVFVDLLGVTRHAIRASVESYSIKKLEPLYSYSRIVDLRDANYALAKLQACLELDHLESVTDEDRRIVSGYNLDDCASARGLRDWLETLRARLVAEGATIDRPQSEADEASEDVSAWQARLTPLMQRLTVDIPADRALRTPEQQARYILAYSLDWHRREQKAVWWEYFRLAALSAGELLEERMAVSGLTFVDTVGGKAKHPIHRYTFPAQEMTLREDDALHIVGGAKLGSIARIDLEGRCVDIKKRADTAALHPQAVFAHDVINNRVMAESLFRIGEYVAEHGLGGPGMFKAARDLLLRLPPDVGGIPLQREGEEASEAARRVAVSLNGALPIQGPPGAGKTFTGARMILDLVRAGKKVGVTANSHTVIRKLLDEAIEAANEVGFDLRCMHKAAEKTENTPHLSFSVDNAEVLAAVKGDAHVGSGTAWFWARPEVVSAVDVLFIDEAAQMSLANVLAVSTAAKSLVLLGDPQQLDQPTQGSHPEGTDVSALDYVLEGHQTMPPDRGLFLDKTWRLHPSICDFTSELFYESRLRARPALERQVVVGEGFWSGAGLRFVPVAHEGNQSSSPEEAECVRKIVNEIIDRKAAWIDRKGISRPIRLDDIVIIAPYNAQVFEIQDRLPGARVGTVDKFQGQEAPVVVYSVTTSSHADAPRGMEFLYSMNRLNVATSRARCVCIVVCNPAVFAPKCRTPRQMQLANGFCRYLELAQGAA
jgi:predicted RecB family nuclease